MNPTALITGASSGIGAELARVAAADQYNLILAARNVASMHALADELSAKHGISVTVFEIDLVQPGASAELYRRVNERGLQVDVLINNAGVGYWDYFYRQDQERINATIVLSVTALTELTRLFLLDMVARKRGGVLNVASTAAYVPEPTMAVYAASKAYTLSFTLALTEELRDTGVVATVLCPGPTHSNFFNTADLGNNPLASGPLMMDTNVVAKAAWAGLKQGRRVVMPGLINRITSRISQFIPYSIMLPGVLRTLSRRS